MRIESLVSHLRGASVAGLTGVPCSLLGGLTGYVGSVPGLEYIRATQEGEAIAIAAGAWLSGVRMVVFAQNSGLGNMVNPITSLLTPARIPVPMLITWRGRPGFPDEPQHAAMGAITLPLLTMLGVTHSVLTKQVIDSDAMFTQFHDDIGRRERSHALVVPPGALEGDLLPDKPLPMATVPKVCSTGRSESALPTRRAVLELVASEWPENAGLICTTGKTGREMFEIADGDRVFYLVGAMGSAAAVGVGVSAFSRKRVMVIDGDGSALMRLGSFATVAAYGGRGLVHLLVDNGVHDSTGGQRSLSEQVDFARVAAACGYRGVFDCSDLSGLTEAIVHSLENPGPSLVRIGVSPGSLKSVGRPTTPPDDIARRFRTFMAS